MFFLKESKKRRKKRTLVTFLRQISPQIPPTYLSKKSKAVSASFLKESKKKKKEKDVSNVLEANPTAHSPHLPLKSRRVILREFKKKCNEFFLLYKYIFTFNKSHSIKTKQIKIDNVDFIIIKFSIYNFVIFWNLGFISLRRLQYKGV